MLGQSGISPTDIAEDPDSMVGVFKAMQFAAGVNDQHLAVHGKVLPGASVKGYVEAQSCLLILANYLNKKWSTKKARGQSFHARTAPSSWCSSSSSKRRRRQRSVRRRK